MKEIDLIPGNDSDGGNYAFCRDKMDAAGIDSVDLSKVIATSLQPFACFLGDGKGMALIISGDEASIIGIHVKDAEGGAS